MREYDINKAAKELDTLAGVVELNTWSDSISIRYSGDYSPLKRLTNDHNLFIRNVDGIVYLVPGPGYSLNEKVGYTPFSPSEFEEINHIDDVGMVEERGEQWMVISTPGVKKFKHLWMCGSGWVPKEIKEAQIRIAPQTTSSSYVLDRSTSQLNSIDFSRNRLDHS